MSNITFVIFTYNEEKRIEYVIRNLIAYGEVLILDGGSTDRTQEISESLNARFVLRPKSLGEHVETGEMYEFVKSVVKTDWIYWGCADHMLPKTLLEKMKELSIQSEIKYVYMPIYTYLWGDVKNIVIKGSYPSFFIKEFVDFSENIIHGKGRFLGNESEILKLQDKHQFAVRHYSTYDQSKFIGRHLIYAKEEAMQKIKDGKRFSLIRMLAAMGGYFFMFIRNIRHGILGVFTLINYVFYRFMTYSVFYKMEHSITADSVEKKYSEDKEKVLLDNNW